MGSEMCIRDRYWDNLFEQVSSSQGTPCPANMGFIQLKRSTSETHVPRLPSRVELAQLFGLDGHKWMAALDAAAPCDRLINITTGIGVCEAAIGDHIQPCGSTRYCNHCLAIFDALTSTVPMSGWAAIGSLIQHSSQGLSSEANGPHRFLNSLPHHVCKPETCGVE